MTASNIPWSRAEFEQRLRAKHEVTAVPEKAVAYISRRCHLVRLFDELRNRRHLAGDFVANLDIAIFGCGTFRFDAERHDPARCRNLDRMTASLGESNFVTHDMVGGKCQHHGLRIAA